MRDIFRLVCDTLSLGVEKNIFCWACLVRCVLDVIDVIDVCNMSMQ